MQNALMCAFPTSWPLVKAGGGGWIRARECFLQLITVAKVHFFSIVYYSQMDDIMLLSSGGSVMHLDTTDSGSRPHASLLRI